MDLLRENKKAPASAGTPARASVWSDHTMKTPVSYHNRPKNARGDEVRVKTASPATGLCCRRLSAMTRGCRPTPSCSMRRSPRCVTSTDIAMLIMHILQKILGGMISRLPGTSKPYLNMAILLSTWSGIPKPKRCWSVGSILLLYDIEMAGEVIWPLH